MNQNSNKLFGQTLLRLLVGLLFLVTGIKKLMSPDGPTKMLTNLGFPVPVVFAWILLLSEIIFGLMIFIGFKVRYAAWPLMIVLIVAEIMVVIPNPQGGILSTTSLFHLVSIAALVDIALAGPGKLAASKK